MANFNRTLVGRAPPHGSLGFVEPRPHAKPEQAEPFAPHIDTHLLFKCEGKARRAMIEYNALDPKLVLVQEHSGRQPLWRCFAPAKGFLRAEFANAIEFLPVELCGGNNKIDRMFAKKIQRVRLKLVTRPRHALFRFVRGWDSNPRCG